MVKYTVKQGDCIESIAFEKGFFWETIWNLPENADLKRIRKNPNALLSGDKVFLPEKQEKEIPCATEKKHRFRQKGVPSMLNIILEDQKDQPLANISYVLEIDGQTYTGHTDKEGRLRQTIPPNAQKGMLYIGENRERQYPLELGHIDPITEVSGIQGRLNNLGFECGPINGLLNDETRAAIRQFQLKYGLEESGEPDQNTRDKIKEVYGN